MVRVKHSILARAGGGLGGGEAVHVLDVFFAAEKLVGGFMFGAARAAGDGCRGEGENYQF